MDGEDYAVEVREVEFHSKEDEKLVQRSRVLLVCLLSDSYDHRTVLLLAVVSCRTDYDAGVVAVCIRLLVRQTDLIFI